MASTHRVNIYFTNGKSLGFVNIDLDSDYSKCDELSQDIRDAIEIFDTRNQDTITIEDNNAEYYINTYEIAYIEILRRNKDKQ